MSYAIEFAGAFGVAFGITMGGFLSLWLIDRMEDAHYRFDMHVEARKRYMKARGK